MRRIVWIGAACAAAAGVFGAYASSAETGAGLIRVAAVQKDLVRVDVGKKGRSPGDVEVITQQIYNRRVTPVPFGSSEFVCTFAIGNSRTCRGTYVLPRGKLVVGGSLQFREFYELAILGGTGLYNNARGTLTATRVGKPAQRREYLIFRLAG